MAKKVVGYIKLQIPAGKATPAPQLHHKDTAGSSSDQKSLQHQIRIWCSEQNKSSYDHKSSGSGNC